MHLAIDHAVGSRMPAWILLWQYITCGKAIRVFSERQIKMLTNHPLSSPHLQWETLPQGFLGSETSCKKCANIEGIFMCVNIHGHETPTALQLRIAVSTLCDKSLTLPLASPWREKSLDDFPILKEGPLYDREMMLLRFCMKHEIYLTTM
uniref:SFRICE_024347 n=1 Tax=Spodoptera frugiperda TaxID=7108 RepID=A0A2H1X2Y4_SPOFR